MSLSYFATCLVFFNLFMCFFNYYTEVLQILKLKHNFKYKFKYKYPIKCKKRKSSKYIMNMSIIKKTFHKFPVGLQKISRKCFKYVRGDYSKYSHRLVLKSELVGNLKSIGVSSGDILFVQSSLGRIGKVLGGADTVIDALMDAVGPEGTLVMPAFSQPYGGMMGTLEKNEVFDPALTPSTVGLIPETFRKRSGVLRSIHPTSSVSAYGAKAKLITEGHNKCSSNFGVGTPLYKIIEYGGKNLGIGIDLGPLSLYHVAEDVIKPFPVKVYLDKEYNAKVIENGNIAFMNVKALDPMMSRTRIDTIPKGNWIRNLFTEVLIDKGVLKFGYVGDAKSWIMGADEFFDVYKDLIDKKVTVYTTEADYKATGQTLISYVKDYRSKYSDNKYDYLRDQIKQVKKEYKQKGFWDPDNKNWIRLLKWTGTDWSGFLPHDWKYATELQEGATHYAMLTGDTALDDNLKNELMYIHSKIQQDGKIEGIPDGVSVSSEEYEYGATLSSLSLGYLYFKDKEYVLAEQILKDMNKVYGFMSSKFTPKFEDHHSVILRAYSNLLLVHQLLDDTKQISKLKAEIHNYANEFLNHQLKNGSFPIMPQNGATRDLFHQVKDIASSLKIGRAHLHCQLKANIGLLLAYKATRAEEYLISAKNNFEWVIKNLLLPNGAVKWNVANFENFFEIHQMLFLICSKYIYDLSGGKYDYTPYAISVWKFLLGDNPAEIDMYVQNYKSTGAFFSFRCLDDKGKLIQYKELYGLFKGAYEMGYTLWALALNKNLSL